MKATGNQKAPSSSRKTNLKRKFEDGTIITAFLAPALIIYLVYVVYSILMTFYYSLLEWSGITASEFIGFANYIDLLNDGIFWQSVKNNLILVLMSVVTQLPLGLIMALLLFSPIRGIKIFQTIYFMPFLMSTVAIGLLFVFILDPSFGLVNNFLGSIGLESLQRGWLGESGTAFWSIVAVITWQFAPFYMILFRAGLVGIPAELYEAAAIDGVNKWQGFRHITFPLLMPTIVTSSILAIIGSLKYFDLIYVMTGGGPNHSTELMATHMYKQAFTNFNMGYGSTVAVGMFIIALIITLTVLGLDGLRKRKGGLS